MSSSGCQKHCIWGRQAGRQASSRAAGGLATAPLIWMEGEGPRIWPVEASREAGSLGYFYSLVIPRMSGQEHVWGPAGDRGLDGA